MSRFLSDTVLLTGEGFAAPVRAPDHGVRTGYGAGGQPGYGAGGQQQGAGRRPVVGIVYYRAHELAGNARFVDALAEAITAAGGTPLPVFCGSLRGCRPRAVGCSTC